MLHPTELRCTLFELRCFLRAMLHLLSYSKLHPSELRRTILSYALPFWATLDLTELRWTLIELRSTLKNISPLPPSQLRCFLRQN